MFPLPFFDPYLGVQGGEKPRWQFAIPPRAARGYLLPQHSPRLPQCAGCTGNKKAAETRRSGLCGTRRAGDTPFAQFGARRFIKGRHCFTPPPVGENRFFNSARCGIFRHNGQGAF